MYWYLQRTWALDPPQPKLQAVGDVSIWVLEIKLGSSARVVDEVAETLNVLILFAIFIFKTKNQNATKPDTYGFPIC